MKILLMLSVLFLSACTQPVACPLDLRICPDGSTVGRMPPDCEFAPCPGGTEANLCTQEMREPQACIDLYDPVCGWFDPQKTGCIEFPCAQTYSNSCYACVNEEVLYWTDGECPENRVE
jgi:hypothetical protein